MNNQFYNNILPQDDDEIWKKYPKDERYFVSTHGRVFSTISKRLLSLSKNNSGYLYFKNIGVHRAVCETFTPCEEMAHLDVDHIDNNRTNNHLDNLRWCTRSFNCKRAVTSETIKRLSNNGKKKKSPEHRKKIADSQRGLKNRRSIPVICTNISTGKCDFYESRTEAWRATGVQINCITKCIEGIFKQYKGYIFKKIELL